jgi:hypothetical protein
MVHADSNVNAREEASGMSANYAAVDLHSNQPVLEVTFVCQLVLFDCLSLSIILVAACNLDRRQPLQIANV